MNRTQIEEGAARGRRHLPADGAVGEEEQRIAGGIKPWISNVDDLRVSAEVSLEGLTTRLVGRPALEHLLEGGGKVGLVDDGGRVRLVRDSVLVHPGDLLPLGHIDGTRHEAERALDQRVGYELLPTAHSNGCRAGAEGGVDRHGDK
jgi:hypothetical protein